MQDEKDKVLPANFDGTFKFTNFTDEVFTARWDNVEYSFPAHKTVPMIIGNATPLQVQSIRKKFARELGIREWYKTPKFVGMNAHTPGGTPALYTDTDIAPFVQRCLEPLPLAQAVAKELPRIDTESRLAVDRKGKRVTRALDKDESLLKEASEAIE